MQERIRAYKRYIIILWYYAVFVLYSLTVFHTVCLAVAAVNEFRYMERERNKEYASENDAGITERDGDAIRVVCLSICPLTFYLSYVFFFLIYSIIRNLHFSVDS